MLQDILTALNIAMLFWNMLFMFCLLGDRETRSIYGFKTKPDKGSENTGEIADKE